MRELPGCFASGRTWDELIEALEEAVGMVLAPREVDDVPVALRVRSIEIQIELDADLPRIRLRAEQATGLLPPPPRSREPHPDWPLRDLRRRDDS